MKTNNEKKPDPQKIEKEISEFLTEKYGDQVKLVPPIVMPEIEESDDDRADKKTPRTIRFDMKPEELIAYLDQYVIKQDRAKTILATKICTHFNRISHQSQWNNADNIVGGVKNNVLMIGPTGVGKTYIIKLIAKKLGVPFIKGDATKFSETGYVGGDVDDLVRDLVREAGNDIELAEHGIVYIDEIDKIASSQYLMGADVSRTGVQRALLSLMEETEVEMKVPHDPVSIMQEVENFRKSGKRERRVVNTKNILFIMSGAFPALQDIIKKRISKQKIGFGADITDTDKDPYQTLEQIKSEDLTNFGLEGEFVGRLPVRVVFSSLTEDDLFKILKNPSNPIILNKKIDFAAYGIDIRFNREALYQLAKNAWEEKTGARGLVNAVENSLIHFESRLPSTDITRLPVTHNTITHPEKALDRLLSTANRHIIDNDYTAMLKTEKQALQQHIAENCDMLAKKYEFPLNPERIDVLSEVCIKTITDMEHAFETVTGYYKEIKNIEPYFFNRHNLDIVFTDDAVCHIIRQYVNDIYANFETIYKELTQNFVDGFQLLSEKAGKNSFSITQQALMFPESWLNNLIKQEFNMRTRKTPRPKDESLPE